MKMAEDQHCFHVILTSLLSSNNDIRTQTEKTYNEIPVASKVVFLITAIQDASKPDEQRQISAILLRRLFQSHFAELQPSLSADGQRELRERLLVQVGAERSETVRRKVCDAVAELARNLLDDDGNNTWPEFLHFLFECSNSPSPHIKAAALHMFATVPGIFGNQQHHYLDLIKQMLQQSLLCPEYSVQFQAVRAISAFILLHDKQVVIQKHFADLLANMVMVMAASAELQDDETLFKNLIDLCETTPKFLRPQLELIIRLCMKVFADEKEAASWRHLALEALVTLSETAPAMMRKEAARYIPQLVPQVLTMMADLEDDAEWSVLDDAVEDDNDSNNVVAESALDRLACGLGGKTMLPHIIDNIPGMLANPNWKYRHAALMAISAVGEGCHKQMEAMLPEIMAGVLNFLQDSHPRVRYATCNAIGQMSSDFAPVFEKKFHDKVIPGLLMVLDDNENPRVQAHAGAALVNFSEDCPKHILIPYLNAIMAKLESILSTKFKELVEQGTKLVLEQVVTTIASVADTSEEQFVAYYDSLMPCLKYIVKNATTPELSLLRGKTIECVSLVGLAVGAEKFSSDASEVMDLLLQDNCSISAEVDDPQSSYLIAAWARICKILGKQFEQYLPLVIGPVMRTASLKPEVALLDNDDMEDARDDVDWQFVSLGEQQNFGIRTAGLEDKASACEMLVCYARELKEGFASYSEEVCRTMVPLLKFYFHDGVRTAAAQSLPCLLECAKIKGLQYQLDMWQFIRPELLKAIDTEPETEVLTELMYSLAKCIETLGNGCLTEESMTELLRILDKLLTEHFDRAIKRIEKRKDEDYDDVVEEQLADEDNDDVYTLSKVADIIHALFVAYKTDFFPFLDTIIGHFVKMLGPERGWADHQWALCVFDDVIEFGGPACVKYQGYFLRPMLEFIADKSPEVRQAAAYGCGVLGLHGGEPFAATCAEVMPRLMEVISDPAASSSTFVNPRENAISAVTKILKHNSSAINVDEILPHWLSWLPVVEDIDEAPYVYGYLCDLITANHAAILGPDNANLPHLISIMATAFQVNVIPEDHEVARRMVDIIKQIQGNGEIFRICISQLSAEQEKVLTSVMTRTL